MWCESGLFLQGPRGVGGTWLDCPGEVGDPGVLLPILSACPSPRCLQEGLCTCRARVRPPWSHFAPQVGGIMAGWCLGVCSAQAQEVHVPLWERAEITRREKMCPVLAEVRCGPGTADERCESNHKTPARTNLGCKEADPFYCVLGAKSCGDKSVACRVKRTARDCSIMSKGNWGLSWGQRRKLHAAAGRRQQLPGMGLRKGGGGPGSQWDAGSSLPAPNLPAPAEVLQGENRTAVARGLWPPLPRLP